MAIDSEKVVSNFISAWPRRDLDELMAFFADDAVYHNIPMPPAKGKDAIRAVINSFLPMAKAVEFKVLKSAAAGDTVFNERVDIFDLGGGKKIELPVAGVFEIRGGKIAAWRDYFDLAMYTKQMS
ncbi:MAG TPA: limonene-1,2-epoxide hydrolase family protein [Candidatus Binataceae bacterium]|jgi:limonene-1,2-epoxide hydrolase